MGKSDPVAFATYLSLLPNREYNNVAFLGFQGNNAFTDAIKSSTKDFYDLQLNNWNINSPSWNIEKEYDLVVCTRCPYFSKDPLEFVENCMSIMKDGGNLLIDWGLGDHWRFPKYKVGWIKDGEHEWAYNKDNFLWSTIWHDVFLENPEFKLFSKWVQKFGYDDVSEAIKQEVPSILNLKDIADRMHIQYVLKAAWEDSPQLYMAILGKKIT